MIHAEHSFPSSPTAPYHRRCTRHWPTGLTTEEPRLSSKEIHQLTLERAGGDYAVSRLPPTAPMPAWADGPGFVTVSRSAHELSIVCLSARVPAETEHEAGWTCMRFVGPFAFGATGIVLSVVRPLSEGRIGVFVVSTFDGDHILIKRADLDRAIHLLHAAGHVIIPPGDHSSPAADA